MLESTEQKAPRTAPPAQPIARRSYLQSLADLARGAAGDALPSAAPSSERSLTQPSSRSP
jgi:hypothetical protein